MTSNTRETLKHLLYLLILSAVMTASIYILSAGKRTEPMEETR